MCELQTLKGLSEPGAPVPELSPLRSPSWLWTCHGGTSEEVPIRSWGSSWGPPLRVGRGILGLLRPSQKGSHPMLLAHGQGGCWFWLSLWGAGVAGLR